jgi:O-antigen ligase
MTGPRGALAVERGFWGDLRPGFFAELFAGVQWTPSFMALLYYTYSVTTYHAPGARYAMIVALFGLLLELQSVRWTGFLSWFGLLVLWAWVSAVQSGGLPTATTGAEDITKLWIISFVIYVAVRSPEQLRFYIAFIIGCFLLYPVRGAYVNYFGGYSLFGRAIWSNAYANPNDLASFALLFLALTLGYALVGRHRLWRLGALGAGASMVVLILLTQSRGGFLALVCTSLIALGVLRQRMRALIVLAVVGTIAIPFVPESAWRRFQGLAKVTSARGMRGVDSQGSAEQRFQVLQVALRMAGDHPLFGVGPKRYAEESVDYGNRMSGQYPLVRGVTDPHNTYLRLATELGLPGVVLFIGMIGGTLRRSWAMSAKLIAAGERAGQMIRISLLGLVAYMLQGLFNSVPYINILYIIVALLACMVARGEGVLAAGLVSVGAEPTRRARAFRRPAGVRGGLSAAGDGIPGFSGSVG